MIRSVRPALFSSAAVVLGATAASAACHEASPADVKFGLIGDTARAEHERRP